MIDSAGTSTPNADKPSSTSRKPAFVTTAAHNLMDKAAKKLKISNIDYASAAIAYFATNGLDPTSQETQGLISVQAKMSEVSLEIRKQNVDIGNRLVAILRAWEANQYKFLQAQQNGVFEYLENIEANILNNQGAMESRVLAPLFQRVVRNGVETHLTRRLAEVLMLKFSIETNPYPAEKLTNSNAYYDRQRDQHLVEELQELLEATP
ncbi:MAG: hypothetical protein EOO61_22300, partial [Hymenobacter sp.]